ncbi:hypothetical protein PCC7424_0203 [Gloeothece citriformis PCC 7424]|uniref:Uncharacterized protein n=1 Tax=Gloeothece citriformis (strain PCC 7424) TaxID=65393 RepID=B7KAK0_GLOC7|nr:COP23 domain-containing protein [Gloeothece citriformis]ACK68672.1 hypothetical protein PCC7424_0203 [Gloeothece citriformis PCC 7424]
MKFLSAFGIFTACSLSLASLTGFILVAQAQQQPVRFICEQTVNPQDNQAYPTTYVVTDRGKIPVIRWNYEWFGNRNTVLQGRCQTVSSSLQAAYDNGSLNFITNTRSDGQPVICSTGRSLGSCVTILAAFRSSDQALEALLKLKEVLGGEIVRLPSPRFSPNSQMFISLDMDSFLANVSVDN